MIGQTVSHYRVLSERGGAGQTLKHLVSGRPVAVERVLELGSQVVKRAPKAVFLRVLVRDVTSGALRR